MTGRELAETVATLIVAVQGTLAEASALLQAGEQQPRDLLGIQAALSGYQADIFDLRLILDGTDSSSFLAVQTGENLLSVWTWERQVRHDLVALAGHIQHLSELVTLLVEGRTRRQHVVRSGETLQQIAAVELGNWQDWPRLLEANPTITAGALASGTVLTIPERR